MKNYLERVPRLVELQQPNSKPVELIGAYRTNLIHEGMPGAEVVRPDGSHIEVPLYAPQGCGASLEQGLC
jgi:hypothetical protein